MLGNVWKMLGKEWLLQWWIWLCAFPGDSHRTCVWSKRDVCSEPSSWHKTGNISESRGRDFLNLSVFIAWSNTFLRTGRVLEIVAGLLALLHNEIATYLSAMTAPSAQTLRPPIHTQFGLPFGLHSSRLKGKTDVCGAAGRPIVWTVGNPSVLPAGWSAGQTVCVWGA
jgi:hypothetical protein